MGYQKQFNCRNEWLCSCLLQLLKQSPSLRQAPRTVIHKEWLALNSSRASSRPAFLLILISARPVLLQNQEWPNWTEKEKRKAMHLQKQELLKWLWLCVMELHHPSVAAPMQDPASCSPAAGQAQPLALGTVTVTHPGHCHCHLVSPTPSPACSSGKKSLSVFPCANPSRCARGAGES